MREPTDRITPRKGRIRQQWKIGTFDIETVPNAPGESALIGKYSLGATCLDHEGKTVRFFPSMLNMLQYMLSFKDTVRWFAHNGANFDFKYFMVEPDCVEWLLSKGYHIEVIGGSIPKALAWKRGHKTILFCDSVKLLNNKLSKLCKDLNVETAKGEIDFDNENFNPKNREHIEYLKRDVISLFQVLEIYRETMIQCFDDDIKCTASSTSFAAFRRTLTKDIFKHPKEVSDFCRQAYYGARTECFFQGKSKTPLSWYDINSLYAYTMYQVGALHHPYMTDVFEPDVPGFYRILAEVPIDFKFGPLPVKRDGLIFPVGNFATITSSVEINLAIELGCNITVLDGVAFGEHDVDLFKPYIQKCMDLRMKDYYGALGTVAKYNQNNLYGFFGMKPEREVIIFSQTMPEGDYGPLIDSHTGEDLPNLWLGMNDSEGVNCIPAFAAWITANARVKLLRAMIAEEKAGNIVYYCDTDSMFLADRDSPVCEVGANYGQWKLEAKVTEFIGLSAKSYMAFEEHGSGVMKCKGIPSRLIEREMYYKALQDEGIVVEYTQLNSLKGVMSGKGLGRGAHRSFATLNSMSSRTSSASGFTQPVRID